MMTCEFEIRFGRIYFINPNANQGPKSEKESAGIPAGIGIPATFVGINFWGQIPAFFPEFVGIISPIGIPATSVGINFWGQIPAFLTAIFVEIILKIPPEQNL